MTVYFFLGLLSQQTRQQICGIRTHLLSFAEMSLQFQENTGKQEGPPAPLTPPPKDTTTCYEHNSVRSELLLAPRSKVREVVLHANVCTQHQMATTLGLSGSAQRRVCFELLEQKFQTYIFGTGKYRLLRKLNCR